jgi:hypothetical protein
MDNGLRQLHQRVPFRLVQRQPIRPMPPRDHQAAARRHRIGIDDAQLPMRSPAAPGRWPPTRRTHSPPRAFHRWPALQRKQRACRLLRSSEPPWFLGTMGSASRARWCRACQATAGAAAFGAALGAGEHPDFDRAADRRAVAAPVPEAAGSCARSRRLLREQTAHLLAALHSEGIEALAAQLQQLVALGVAQLLPAHQAVGASLVAGDAV